MNPAAVAATSTPPALPAARAVRFDRLDALRAVAILWMASFHFGFDLAHFGITRQNFYHDPVWTMQRTCIVSLFLFCVGLGQAIAVAQGQPWERFWRRWAQVAGCAVLVSIGSALMFPQTWISFGVLHGIAVMLIVARLTAGWGAWLWPLGLVALLLPHWVRDPFFETRWTNPLGLVVLKPRTEDWVPVFPWLGVVWWGVAAGSWLLAHRPGVLSGPVPAFMRPLTVLGRWSLTFYMVHQPVLIGLVLAALWLAR